MDERKPRLLDNEALWSYALKALAARAHSTGELREKLRRRAARAGDIDDVLARLKEIGYLDDRRYAEAFASARLANEKFGRGRVLRDLRERRVAPAVAERTVETVYREVNEDALIDQWIRRKYRASDRETLFEKDSDLASAYRRLLRAGFRTGDILRALKKFAKNPDLLDGFEPPQEAE
jgi:regulatory protein